MKTLRIPVPMVRPFDVPISASDVQAVWAAYVTADQDGAQSVEMRTLMAILRAVHAGMLEKKK